MISETGKLKNIKVLPVLESGASCLWFSTSDSVTVVSQGRNWEVKKARPGHIPMYGEQPSWLTCPPTGPTINNTVLAVGMECQHSVTAETS